MSASVDILLVDDERIVRKTFRELFEAEGFSVREAKNGEEGVSAFEKERPGLVLLDVMMPKKNGLQACEEIRARDSSVPILFLSGVPSETTQLRAYGVGADDYIEKDRNPDLIVAKVRATLRRGALAAPPPPVRIRLGATEVDGANLEVSRAGEICGHLTKTEGDILWILASARGRTFSTDELIARLRGEGFACEDAMLYVHVSNLRRKLGPASPLLVSARGVGYTLLPN